MHINSYYWTLLCIWMYVCVHTCMYERLCAQMYLFHLFSALILDLQYTCITSLLSFKQNTPSISPHHTPLDQACPLFPLWLSPAVTPACYCANLLEWPASDNHWQDWSGPCIIDLSDSRTNAHEEATHIFSSIIALGRTKKDWRVQKELVSKCNRI